MASKEKLPFWMGVVLGMLLGILLVLLIIVPQLSPKQQKLPVSAMHDVPIITPTEPVPVMEQSPVLDQSPVMDQSPEKAPEKPPSAAKPLITVKPHDLLALPPIPHHKIALVLDDVGYDLDALKRLLRLSVPIAVSILPDAPYAHQAAELAKQAGQVIMLHLPMQPEDPSLQMDDAFLTTSMSDQALRTTFLHNLDKVPYVEGVNNHMGSKLTQLNAPMQSVMQVCKDKGLFFIDSRTSAASVAADVAEQAGVPWASRSIFLDHEMTLSSMKKAWHRARQCVKKNMTCIVIAHPRAKTVTFLENYLNKEDASNMVSVRRLLHAPQAIRQKTAAAQ